MTMSDIEQVLAHALKMFYRLLLTFFAPVVPFISNARGQLKALK